MDLTRCAPALRLDCADGVTVLTLLRGEQGNRLSRAVIDELVEALRRSAADLATRVLVLRAEGESFCLGLDFGAFLDPATTPDLEGLRLFQETMLLIYRHPAPVIAAVEGRVEGGGLGLVAACDLVIAGSRARFMLPEVVVGMIPCMILPFLRRRLTPGALRYLGLSSRAVGAPEALGIGLADEDAGEAEVGRAVERQIKRLLRSSPNALREVKQLTEQFAGGDLDQEVRESFEHLAGWLQRPEVTEGARLFAQGFSPPWFARRRSGHAS